MKLTHTELEKQLVFETGKAVDLVHCFPLISRYTA